MKIKLLYILNVANKVNNFSYASMSAAHERGIEFHIAGNWGYQTEDERKKDEKKYGIHIYQIDFIRTPYHPGNFKAYKQLAKIVEKEKFDIIHCNTPIGGIVGRLLGKKYHIKKVLYQAHGFHFYKGAPLFNRTVLKWAEQIMAHWTDVIITMNQEDYEAAKKFRLKKGGKVFFVHGVGIDIKEYDAIEQYRDKKREELGFSTNDTVLISMGDLIKRKNYNVAVKAIAKLKNPNIYYIICGKGPEQRTLEELTESLGISSQIHFLGFRTDIKELLAASDIFLFTSLQEGLPRSLMEAMTSGLPCVVSKIRGNVDLIEDGKGGFLCEPDDIEECARAIEKLYKNPELCRKMCEFNLDTIKEYDVSVVIKEIYYIYNEVLKG